MAVVVDGVLVVVLVVMLDVMLVVVLAVRFVDWSAIETFHPYLDHM